MTKPCQPLKPPKPHRLTPEYVTLAILQRHGGVLSPREISPLVPDLAPTLPLLKRCQVQRALTTLSRLAAIRQVAPGRYQAEQGQALSLLATWKPLVDPELHDLLS